MAEFTVEHAKRNQLRVTLGMSETNQSQPSSTWYPQMISFDGGAYAFDGTTTPISATFAFDFTDLVETADGQRFHLGLYDSTSGDPVQLYTYSLIDVANGETTVHSVDVPQTGDAGQLYTSIDYDGSGTISNQPPVADVVAMPVSGDMPLMVTFDAGGSRDADGSIASYQWSFGDGSSGSGAVVGHTYTRAGQFTAVLTVTDNDGAMDTAAVVITVVDSNLPPRAEISATPVSGDLPLPVSFSGGGSSDADGTIASYQWSFGDGESASGMTVEHIYAQAGTFTAVLTVTDNKGAQDTASAVITVDDPSVLNAPDGLTAVASGNLVTLSWIASNDNADGYHIERAIKYRGKYNFTRVASISAIATSYVDAVSESGTYKYRVQAYSTSPESDGLSDYSNEASVAVSETVTPDPEPAPDPVEDTFAAPGNLSATVSGDTALLTWTDNTTDETGFIIERGVKVIGVMVYENIGQTGAGQTSFADACGAGTFVYRVRAFKSGCGVCLFKRGEGADQIKDKTAGKTVLTVKINNCQKEKIDFSFDTSWHLTGPSERNSFSM